MNKKDFNKVVELFKERTQKECVNVILENQLPNILDNKIGGLPYLPINEEYPKDKNGKPLALLLQVNLKDIDLPNFPKEGILEIFTDKELDWPCSYTIKLFKEGLDYITDFSEFDIQVDFPLVANPSKISFEKIIDYMPLAHIGYEDILNEICYTLFDMDLEEVNDTYECELEFDLADKLDYYSITIGGYANFTQNDIRESREHKDKTECLFKLDSTIDYKNFSIGDSGILFTVISLKDLKNANFKNAIVDWDCC